MYLFLIFQPLQQLSLFHLSRNILIQRKPWTILLLKRHQEVLSKLFTLVVIMSSISNIQVFLILFTLLSCMVWDYHSFSQLLQQVFSLNGWMKDSMLHTWTNFPQLLMTNWQIMPSMLWNGLHFCYVSMDIGWLVINKSSITLGNSLKELEIKWFQNISFTTESIGLFHCFLYLYWPYFCQLLKDISQKDCRNLVLECKENKCKLMKIFLIFMISPLLHKEDKWQRCITIWNWISDLNIQILIPLKHWLTQNIQKLLFVVLHGTMFFQIHNTLMSSVLCHHMWLKEKRLSMMDIQKRLMKFQQSISVNNLIW